MQYQKEEVMHFETQNYWLKDASHDNLSLARSSTAAHSDCMMGAWKVETNKKLQREKAN